MLFFFIGRLVNNNFHQVQSVMRLEAGCGRLEVIAAEVMNMVFLY
jgi:hypothetical protein